MADLSLESTALPEETTHCKSSSKVLALDDEVTSPTDVQRIVEKEREQFEAEVARLHEIYARQIDTLESIIQDKDVQIHQYQQTVGDQTCELANLREELAYLKSRDLRQADPKERNALLEAMCEVKLEQLYARVKPSIVRINLAIGRLVSMQEEGEVADAEVSASAGLAEVSFASSIQGNLHSEETPAESVLKSFLETAKQNSFRLHDTAFQLSRREISRSETVTDADPEEPISPLVEQKCEKCGKLWKKVEKLKVDIKKHKAFIETMKKGLETMLGAKRRRV